MIPLHNLLASYLRTLAISGKNPENSYALWGFAIGCTALDAKAARDILAQSNRLLYSESGGSPVSIDGFVFERNVWEPSETYKQNQAIKEILMKFFKPVYDPYTTMYDTRTPREQPDALIVGGTSMRWEDCVALASKLTTKC